MAIGVNIDMLLDMLLAFLYLVYMNKIREAIVKRDGIADRGLSAAATLAATTIGVGPV